MKKIIITISIGMLFCANLLAGNSPWYFRLRAINVNPDVSSTPITIIGGKVKDISDTYTPEFDINYFLNDTLSLELILATSKHNVEAKRTALDVAGKTKLGSVYILPPTLLLQYHFMPKNQIDPYVGIGMNYTHFYNEKEHRSLTDIDYKDSLRPAFQAGADIKINKDWFINLDLKKVYVRSDVTVTSGATVVKTTVDLDPYIFGIGVGYRL